MPRAIHFELYADDPERAARFYADSFAWSVERWPGESGPVYWLLTTGEESLPGINGDIQRRSDPAAATSIILAVSSVDDLRRQNRRGRRQGPAAQVRHPRHWLRRLLSGYRGQPIRHLSRGSYRRLTATWLAPVVVPAYHCPLSPNLLPCFGVSPPKSNAARFPYAPDCPLRAVRR